MSEYIGQTLLFYQYDQWINFEIIEDLGEILLIRTDKIEGIFRISKNDWNYQVRVIDRLASGRID